MIDMFLNFLFPNVCGICGTKNEFGICKKCYKKLKFNIVIKEEYGLNYDEVIYFFKYKDVRNLILNYKFYNKSYFYNMFSNIILKNKKICRKLKFYDIIIPVPMDKKSKQKRGYNQTELISNFLSKKLGICYDSKVLIKVKKTKTQSTLKQRQRYKNVDGAFGIKNSNIIKNKNIILFDDIVTTGATVNECAKVLKQNGAKKILVLAIAKD